MTHSSYQQTSLNPCSEFEQDGGGYAAEAFSVRGGCTCAPSVWHGIYPPPCRCRMCPCCGRPLDWPYPAHNPPYQPWTVTTGGTPPASTTNVRVSYATN